MVTRTWMHKRSHSLSSKHTIFVILILLSPWRLQPLLVVISSSAKSHRALHCKIAATDNALQTWLAGRKAPGMDITKVIIVRVWFAKEHYYTDDGAVWMRDDCTGRSSVSVLRKVPLSGELYLSGNSRLGKSMLYSKLVHAWIPPANLLSSAEDKWRLLLVWFCLFVVLHHSDTCGHGVLTCDTEHAWLLYSAAPLEDEATGTMSWNLTSSH